MGYRRVAGRAYLHDLLCVLLVGEGRVVLVRCAVEGFDGLVLLLDGLVERMLCLVGGL